MKPYTKSTFKIYWQHSKKYPWLLFFTLAGMAIAVGADLYQPFLYKWFFDILVTGKATAGPLIHILVLIMWVGFINWAFWRVSSFANNAFESRVMSDLLNTSFSYLQNHSYSYFNNNFAGSLIRKVNRYSRAFEDIVDQFTANIGQVVLRLLIILIVLFFRSFWLGFTVLIWSILYILFNYWFALWKIKYDVQRAAMDTKITGQMADTTSNNINLKLFGGTKSEIKTFYGLTEELYKIRKLSWDLGQISETVQGFLMVILEFVVMYIAVIYWQKGQVTVGDFVLFQSYLIQMFLQLWNFGRFVRRIYESLADANEMTEILLTPHEIQNAPGAGTLQINKGGIEFKNVGFAYDNNPSVFQNFNLQISAGQRVALIGPSGGGKSTVVKLLFRFLDIQSGEILIDGQNIAKVTQESLRQNIALVPQDPILFHRSLLENIRYGKPEATEEQVINAAKLAHADEFISKFPEQYKTYVGERGVKLSGGERQRVAIARAILKNAPILILDEATSSLDSESEHYIQDALKNLMANKTVIVIAHRLSTIMQMDQIIVLENGQITEAGTHNELLKAQNGTYQRLWHIQAGGFA